MVLLLFPWKHLSVVRPYGFLSVTCDWLNPVKFLLVTCHCLNPVTFNSFFTNHEFFKENLFYKAFSYYTFQNLITPAS